MAQIGIVVAIDRLGPPAGFVVEAADTGVTGGAGGATLDG